MGSKMCWNIRPNMRVIASCQLPPRVLIMSCIWLWHVSQKYSIFLFSVSTHGELVSWVQKAQDFGSIMQILSGVVKGSLLNERGRKNKTNLFFLPLSS